METGNLYTAFLALALSLIDEDGELIAITPRSFCNGPYYRQFRKRLIANLSLHRMHVFEARDQAFADDAVLQENVIIHGIRTVANPSHVMIASSRDAKDSAVVRRVPYEEVVRPGDREYFIHITSTEAGASAAAQISSLPCTLGELGLEVSTGRVVDFRARDWLRAQPDPATAPLIYPAHFSHGEITWPKAEIRKPNAIAIEPESRPLLVPSGVYVLVKRFSAKEERRRVVAALFDPEHVQSEVVGFENHLNYFHARGKPIDMDLARGLGAFLNSTALDTYFRQFNGHTQVNATDLRNIRYPPRDVLLELGRRVGRVMPPQSELDAAVEAALAPLAGAA
jgi:adenine-specific DNA-methyltransferase